MEIKYCGNCKQLSLTEEGQHLMKLNHHDHICILLNKRVLHGEHHPELPILEDCPMVMLVAGSRFKTRS